jgi:hypothetical protein
MNKEKLSEAISYILVFLVAVFTVFAILPVWELLHEDVAWKSMATVLLLFLGFLIAKVIIKSMNEKK